MKHVNNMPEYIFIPAGTYMKIRTEEEVSRDVSEMIRERCFTSESINALQRRRELREEAESGDEVSAYMAKEYDKILRTCGRGRRFNEEIFYLQMREREARRRDRED